MKKTFLPLLLILALTSTGFSWPFGKKDPNPKPTPAQTVIVPEKPTPASGKGLLAELKTQLIEAKQKLAEVTKALEGAKKELADTKDKVVVLQKQIDELKEWGIAQQAEAQKYFKKYNEAVKRYHRLKMIAAVIAAAVGVLIGLQFMNLAPPPYNFGVPVGAAALFASLVWFFL